MINKWTLKIKDVEIQKDFEKYVMESVVSKGPYWIGFEALFTLSALLGLLDDSNFLNYHRAGSGIGCLLTITIPYALTKTTGKTVFMKWMPLLFMLFWTSISNYIIFYALSEKG